MAALSLATTRTRTNVTRAATETPHLPLAFSGEFITLKVQSGKLESSPLTPISQLPNELDAPSQAARVFVVESGSPPRSLQGLSSLYPPRSFTSSHLQEFESLHSAVYQEVDEVLFARWSRVAKQSEEKYRDELRIREGKYYDIDTFRDRDPQDLLQDHRRHYHWPERPNRTYDLVAEEKSGKWKQIIHAARGCMSFYYAPSRSNIAGFLLVDPVRHHRVVEYKYGKNQGDDTEAERYEPCFLGAHRPLDRFVTTAKDLAAKSPDFGKTPGQEGKDLVVCAKETIVQLVYDDLAQVLRRTSASLDAIELALHDNNVLRRSVPQWRDQLGRWRNALFHQERSLRYMSKKLQASSAVAVANTGAGRSSGSEGSAAGLSDESEMTRKLQVLEEDLAMIRSRIDGTFQTLMSAMSIVESERAIQQAEVVSKLTHLAFFFIPLTLVSTIFGMNVVEWEGKLTWWYWLLLSLGTTAVTYIALYWRETLRSCADVMILAKTNVKERLKRWRGIKATPRSMAYAAGTLTILAGLGIATWQVFVSDLSRGGKAAIAFCVIWGPLIVGILLFVGRINSKGLHASIRRRRRRTAALVHRL